MFYSRSIFSEKAIRLRLLNVFLILLTLLVLVATSYVFADDSDSAEEVDGHYQSYLPPPYKVFAIVNNYELWHSLNKHCDKGFYEIRDKKGQTVSKIISAPNSVGWLEYAYFDSDYDCLQSKIDKNGQFILLCFESRYSRTASACRSYAGRCGSGRDLFYSILTYDNNKLFLIDTILAEFGCRSCDLLAAYLRDNQILFHWFPQHKNSLFSEPSEKGRELLRPDLEGAYIVDNGKLKKQRELLPEEIDFLSKKYKQSNDEK